MQGNFRINLPSIPTALIKFKVQDTMAKNTRFKEDKTYLTGRFIASFQNLHPAAKSPSSTVASTMTQSTTNPAPSFSHNDPEFRWMVPDTRKNLLLKYEQQLKNYEAPVRQNQSLHNGYSFQRQGMKDSLDALRQHQSVDHSKHTSFDNHFFMKTEQSDQEGDGSDQRDEKEELERRRQEKIDKKKYVLPSAVFKSRDRWKDLERQIVGQKGPGPGSYIRDMSNIRKKTKKKSTIKKQVNPEEKLMNSKKAAKLLEELSAPTPSREVPYQKDSKSEREVIGNSSSFMEGNTDRFGSQILPINPHLNVPGPGSYKTSQSIEDRANKLLIIEEQRKLLKQWYYD